MKFQSFVPCVVVLLALGACKSSGGSNAPKMTPEEVMAKTMELGIPGSPHQELTAQAGRWTKSMKWRMSPDAPWEEMTGGTCDSQVLLGGRYLLEHTNASFGGMPFEGYNLLGYDNMRGEYTSVWMDSMSTWWITSSGKKDKDGSINFKGTMRDAAGGRPFRMVVKTQSDGSVVNNMFDTIDDKEVHVMTITAKR